MKGEFDLNPGDSLSQNDPRNPGRLDPHYYPKESKTSIWNVFKKVKDFSGDCINYNYVISRSPHGDPIHMHFRYGEDIEALLAMSNDEKDSNFNLWSATYCDIERTTACD